MVNDFEFKAWKRLFKGQPLGASGLLALTYVANVVVVPGPLFPLIHGWHGYSIARGVIAPDSLESHER